LFRNFKNDKEPSGSRFSKIEIMKNVERVCNVEEPEMFNQIFCSHLLSMNVVKTSVKQEAII